MKQLSLFISVLLYPIIQVECQMIIVSPSAIINNLTNFLTVNCTYQTGSDPMLASLTSLTISRSDDALNLQAQVLSSVDSFNGVTNIASGENFTAVGKIDNTGQSYLSVSWYNPFLIQPGVYKCDAAGLNTSGQPLVISSTVNLTRISPSPDILAQEIVQLKVAIDQLSKVTSSFMNTWSDRMNQIQTILFKPSEVFRGSQYLLYIYQPTHVPGMAQATCHLYGGYLAEIQDSDEHDFIVSFIQQFSWIKSLLVGGYQAGEVGNWVYPSNNKSLEYYRWAYPYPFDAIDYDCLVLWDTYNFNLTNQQCTSSQPSGSLYYLCEIPGYN